MVDEISIIIPAYNEIHNMEKAVCQIQDIAPALFGKYEIIIVNDGSNDGTEHVIENLSAKDHNIKVINFKYNKGYGAALKAGFNSAGYEYIFYTDSDGQYDFGEINKLLPLAGRYDLVAGFRLGRKDSFFRKIYSSLYNSIIFVLLHVRFKDINCSFKLFKKEILRKISLESHGFAIDAELVWKAHLAGFSIGRIGVTHFQRDKGKSKIKYLNDAIVTLKELYRITNAANKINRGGN